MLNSIWYFNTYLGLSKKAFHFFLFLGQKSKYLKKFLNFEHVSLGTSTWLGNFNIKKGSKAAFKILVKIKNLH